MMPKTIGRMPSCRTRYIGRMLATISDDTSVNRLVRPSAQTVELTAGSQRVFGLLIARAVVCRRSEQVEELRRVRANSPAQSTAYIRVSGRDSPPIQQG